MPAVANVARFLVAGNRGAMSLLVAPLLELEA